MKTKYRRSPKSSHPWKQHGPELFKSRTDAYSAYQGEGIMQREIKKMKKGSGGCSVQSVTPKR